MAERARALVQCLLNNEDFIETVANVCSNNTAASPNVHSSFDRVDDEVRSLFNRGAQTRVPDFLRPDPSVFLRSGTGPGNLIQNGDISLSVSSMSNPQQLPVPSYNLRRLPRINSRRQTRRTRELQHVTFTKEVVLLPDNSSTLVPRRASKAWLYDHGHVKSAVEFNIEWDESEVMATIRRSFMPLVDGCSEYVSLLEIEEYDPSDASLQEAIGNSLSDTTFGTLK
nr:uncharacterized protein LOC111858077 [Paramormyrops kingsleyae]